MKSLLPIPAQAALSLLLLSSSLAVVSTTTTTSFSSPSSSSASSSLEPVRGLDLAHPTYGKECVVRPLGGGADDSDLVLAAFDECRRDAVVRFENETYRIDKVLEIRGLDNVMIDLRGRLEVCYLSIVFAFPHGPNYPTLAPGCMSSEREGEREKDGKRADLLATLPGVVGS